MIVSDDEENGAEVEAEAGVIVEIVKELIKIDIGNHGSGNVVEARTEMRREIEIEIEIAIANIETGIGIGAKIGTSAKNVIEIGILGSAVVKKMTMIGTKGMIYQSLEGKETISTIAEIRVNVKRVKESIPQNLQVPIRNIVAAGVKRRSSTGLFPTFESAL